MSAEPVSLPPMDALPPGQRYDDLRRRGLEFATALSSEVWTDYNAHDPGVTIVEQLCYALTETAYRADAPLADRLADADGQLDLSALALPGPRRAHPAAPLTSGDLQRLLLDRLPELAGAWIAPARHGSREDVRGVFDVRLYAPQLPESRRAELNRRAAALVRRRRNLCEDLGRSTVLRPARVALSASVDLASDASPEPTVAGLVRRLELRLAPEVSRRAVKTGRGIEARLSDVFTGPLLRRGWPDEATLALPPGCTWAALVHAGQAAEGVLALRDLSLELGDRRFGGADPLEPITGSGELAELALEAAGDLDLRVWRRGARLPLDLARVKALLDGLRRHDRSPDAPLRNLVSRETRPRGRPGMPPPYTPVHADLPDLYRLRPRGSEAADWRAQQLRGYLTGFDLALADMEARLSAETAPLLRQPPSRSVFDIVGQADPSARELLAPSADQLRLEEDRTAALRRARLVRRSAQHHLPTVRWDGAPAPADDLARRLARAARAVGARRRAPDVAKGRRSDLEIALTDLFAMNDGRHPFAEVLAAADVELATSEREFRSAEGRMRRLEAAELGLLLKPPRRVPAAAMRRLRLSPEMIASADVRFGELAGGTPAVVLTSAGGAAWRVAEHATVEAACDEAIALQHALAEVRLAARRLFLVEHVLLRDALEALGPLGCASTVTLLVCDPTRAESHLFRRAMADEVRARAPAHLRARVAFLPLTDLPQVERIVIDWRKALAEGDGRHRREASAPLAAYLRDLIGDEA